MIVGLARRAGYLERIDAAGYATVMGEAVAIYSGLHLTQVQESS
jgi:hypothetical protein